MKISEYNKIINLKPKTNKYNNVRSSYGGVVFHSKKEAVYARNLDLLKSAKDPAQRVVIYETQVKYPFIHDGMLICRYELDFKVTYGDGRVEHIDVKSPATRKNSTYRIKKKMMKAFYNIEVLER